MWDGLPTYPAESQPDFYFRLRYDPASWALVTDQFGHAVLASRALPIARLELVIKIAEPATEVPSRFYRAATQ